MEKYLKEVNRFKKTKSPGSLIFILKTIFKEVKKDTGWNYLHIASDYLSKRRKLNVNPHEYYLYDLYDAQMPEQFRNKFLSRVVCDAFLERLNPLDYILLARNKYITKILLKSLDIPTPEMLFLYDPQAGLESAKVINRPENVKKKLIEIESQPFVVKRLDGEHGKNINVYTRIETIDGEISFVHINGEIHTLNQMINSAGENQKLLFELKVKQAPHFDVINPTSINTIRMLTVLHPDGKAELIYSLMRMGRKGKWVDNSGKGGNISANVNKETGALENVVFFKNYKSRIPVTHHPDSGVDLANYKIENWDGLKNQVLNFHRKLSWLKAIGWDVAITENGPVIIEINNRWDILGQVTSREGWYDHLDKLYKEWGEFGDV